MAAAGPPNTNISPSEIDMKYSKSTGCFYFPNKNYTDLPNDLIEVSDVEFSLAVTRPTGATLSVVKGKLKIIPPAISATEQLRNNVIAEIGSWRDRQENSLIVFEHAGRRWDGGKVVRERLVTIISAMKTVGEIDGFFWTDADNNDVPVTLPELEALVAVHDVAIAMQGNKIHVRQRQMKDAVAAMDETELAAFVLGWGDVAGDVECPVAP